MLAALQKMGTLSSIQDVSADVTITSSDPSQPVVTARFRLLGPDRFRSEDDSGKSFLIANNDVVSIEGEPKWFSLSTFSPVCVVFPWLTIVRNNPLSRADADGHSDYLWQKVKNWAEGNGYRTNAQVQGLSVAQTAANHKGSMDWAINTNNSSGKDVGHPQDFHSGQDKCNQFVGDTLAEAGKARPEITDKDGNTRMPNAHELADPNVHIPGLSDPKPLSDAKPGDVIAQEHGDTYGHTGIVVGPGQTASANATGSYGGQITVNNWGFRPAGQNGESGSDPAPVVRTPQ